MTISRLDYVVLNGSLISEYESEGTWTEEIMA